MAKGIKIRLNGDDSQLLEEIAEDFGSPTAAVCESIRILADERRSRLALREFHKEWIAEFGPPDPAASAELGRRFFGE